MPIFDVTINRTGCVMVEADTPEEACLIAQTCEEDEVSWTDGWDADSADPIAASMDEMEEDAALVVSDPYVKARMLAQQCGYFCCPSTDGRICLTPHFANDGVSVMELKAELESRQYTTEVVPAAKAYGASLEYERKLYAPEDLSKVTDVPKEKLVSYSYNQFLLVGLPNTFTARIAPD